PSLFRYMKEAGYQIQWFGKNHVYTKEYLNEILGEQAEHAFMHRTSGFKAVNPYDINDSRYYSFLYEPREGDAHATDTWRYIQNAVDFLKSDDAHEQPFMLYLPITDPHAPYVVPEPYYSMYNPDELPELKPYD